MSVLPDPTIVRLQRIFYPFWKILCYLGVSQ